MVATVYAKWINGEADITEMAKLNTRAACDTDAGTRDKNFDENAEKNAVTRADKDDLISVGENKIGS